jgi:hypothetical protein
MRSRVTLVDLAKVLKAQEALEASSNTALARAAAEERSRLFEVDTAAQALDGALDDWRSALHAGRIDLSLIQLYAQAPIRCEADLSEARVRLQIAARRTETQRQHHAKSIAQTTNTRRFHKKLAKHLARKNEEKTQSVLEQRISRARSP